MPHEARRLIESFSTVAREILRLAHADLRRADFLHKVSTEILNFSQCDVLDIFLLESERYHRSTTSVRGPSDNEYETISAANAVLSRDSPVSSENSHQYLALCCSVLADRVECADTDFCTGNSFWITQVHRPLTLFEKDGQESRPFTFASTEVYPSVALLPFDLEGSNRGLLVLRHSSEHAFSHDKIDLLRGVANLLGMPIIHRRTQIALRERIKELTCLYGIARLAGAAGTPLPEILAAAADLLPRAWLYPESTSARIVLDDQEFLSCNYRGGHDKLSSNIIVDGNARGIVEVAYADTKPTLVEGPFLQEERHLIDVVAKELELIIDKYGSEKQRRELQEQLRHADRLATLGQLSAGVAHELNEPLGGILGFAQLAQKIPGVPQQVQEDLGKIVAASLHAREVIKKLMLFARQEEPGKGWVDLNMLVANGLYFLESRCAKAGVDLVRHLEADLPEIAADAGQVYQVIVNLAVNAIQAMPHGGQLSIRTTLRGAAVELEIQDTGTGMSEELQRQIFLPFFTTKDVGEGTGLGLSVVQGIVSSHGGAIKVASTKGVGTVFTVQLPATEHTGDA